MSAPVALLSTNLKSCFSSLNDRCRFFRYPNDRIVEHWVTDWNWSERASQFINLFARNLTLNSSSNWATELLPVRSANKVPFADDDYLEMPARYLPLNCTSDGHRIDGGIP